MSKFYIISLIGLNTILLFIVINMSYSFDIIQTRSDIHSQNKSNISLGIKSLNAWDKFEGNKTPYVITFLNMDGCPSCVAKEIDVLSDSTISQSTNYYLVVLNPNKRPIEGIHNSVKVIDYATWIQQTDIDITFINPISLLIDNNFIYHYRYVDTSRPFNEKLTDAYYSFLSSFFAL